MDITVRGIEAVDNGSILGMFRHELGHSGLTYEDIARRIEIMRQDSSYLIFVAIASGQVVGFIGAVSKTAFECDKFLHIIALAVREEYQNQGIGSLLLRHMEENAAANGIYSIILNSGFQRTDAHAFYQKKGYLKKSYSFYKDIEG